MGKQNICDKDLSTGFRVLHVTETAIGGIASYLDELLPMQMKVYGTHAVKVILPALHTTDIKHVPEDSIVGFRDRGSRLLNTWELTKQVNNELRVFQPHVIHIHSSFAGFSVRPLSWFRFGRPKIVYCPHGWAFNRDNSWFVTYLVKRIEQAWSRLCDAIICISKHEYDSGLLIGIPASRLHVIYNGISPDVKYSAENIAWPNDKLRVLFVGRFDRQKGVDTFIGAMSQVEDLAYAYLIGAPVIGGEPLPTIPINISLVGWQSRERLQSFYQSADVLVMPSRWEGFGLTAVEAMRSGLPVIASAVGGLVEIVEAGKTGILVEPNDASSIANVIRHFNRNMLESMGNAGRSRFTLLFTSDRMFSDIHKLYAKLLFRGI